MRFYESGMFESNRSLIQELTFSSLKDAFQIRGLTFTEVQMKNLGILSSDDIYTNLGLLVSDQCRHSIKFAIFQGNDKLVFKDRKELTGSLFTQLADAFKTIPLASTEVFVGNKGTLLIPLVTSSLPSVPKVISEIIFVGVGVLSMPETEVLAIHTLSATFV